MMVHKNILERKCRYNRLGEMTKEEMTKEETLKICTKTLMASPRRDDYDNPLCIHGIWFEICDKQCQRCGHDCIDHEGDSCNHRSTTIASFGPKIEPVGCNCGGFK